MISVRILPVKLAIAVALGFYSLAPAQNGGAIDDPLVLWPDGAPGALGDKDTDVPRLTVHFADPKNATGTAVIVNPGGGYRMVASDHEGLQVAKMLNRHGITAFVLRYRLLPEYQPSTALLDAQRAVRCVRHNAEKYGISKARIGMLGFSAGGHLTTAAGTHFDAGDPNAADPIDRESCRPDFLVPVYPAVSRDLLDYQMGDWMSTDQDVTKDTPPAFLAHTTEDGLVTPKHSLRFYEALIDKGVSAEIHIFQYGPHGTGLAPGDPQFSQWPDLLAQWLRRSALLTDEERASVAGTVTLDGEPVFWGSVTFIPLDDHLPASVANFGSTSKGKYSIAAKLGPCPGMHRVEVCRVASKFPEPKSGAYSLDDAEVYTLPNPVEIKAGANTIEIAVTSR